MPLTEARRKRIALESDPDCRRASSRGLIPKAKVKTIKMTFVIVFGEFKNIATKKYGFQALQTNHVSIIQCKFISKEIFEKSIYPLY